MSLKKNKVVFYEAFEEEQGALRENMSEKIDAVYFKETIQEAEHLVPPAEIISVRTQSSIPLEWADKLSGILTRSTGHDHLSAYRAAVQKEIPCGHLPSYCSRAVAEQAVLMMMALWRKLPQQMAQVKTFSRDGLTGKECLGKNVAVIGVGRIGTEIIRIVRALGMNAKGVDIDPREAGVEYVSFEDGLLWADAVVVAAPLNEKTRKMFNGNVFHAMKNTAVFVNIARGEISPLAGIKHALEKGEIAGAALDVYDDEGDLGAALRKGKGEDLPAVKIFEEVIGRQDVILTPHNAFNTQEAVQRKARQSIETLEHFFETGHFIDPVPQKSR